jgi:hypothetical protein
MHRRSARLALLVAAATLFVVGPTLSQPRVAQPPRKASEGRAASGSIAPDPGRRPAAAAPATASPTATSPAATSAEPVRASAPATACASGTDLTYTQPASMAPVTNRSTCRHQGRGCCEETRDWCLAEGFIWQNCRNCYCGAQCMGPSLVD